MQTWKIPRSILVQVKLSNYSAGNYLTPNLPLQKKLNQLNVSGPEPKPWSGISSGHPEKNKNNKK